MAYIVMAWIPACLPTAVGYREGRGAASFDALQVPRKGRLQKGAIVMAYSYGRLQKGGIVMAYSYGRLQKGGIVMAYSYGRLQNGGIVMAYSYGRLL